MRSAGTGCVAVGAIIAVRRVVFRCVIKQGLNRIYPGKLELIMYGRNRQHGGFLWGSKLVSTALGQMHLLMIAQLRSRDGLASHFARTKIHSAKSVSFLMYIFTKILYLNNTTCLLPDGVEMK